MGAEIITTNQTSQYTIAATSFVTLMPGVTLTVEATTAPGFLADHDSNCTLTILGTVVTYGSGAQIGKTSTATGFAAVTVGDGGLVQSLTGFGLDIRRSGTLIDNAGVIAGGNAGVNFAAGVDGAQLTNTGTISSLRDAAIVAAGAVGGVAPSLFEIVNTGTLKAATIGVSIGRESLALTNHGDIISLGTGISLTDDPALDNTLTLVNTGLIQGDTAAIAATGHADSVTNMGTLLGNLWLRDGHNRLDNSGLIAGVVTAGTGDDVFTNAATGTVSAGVDLGAGANVVTNHGALAAGLTLGAGDDSLLNRGTITGPVILGDGTNSATFAGVVTGAVTGGANADLLKVFGEVAGAITLGDGADELSVGGQIRGNIDLGTGGDIVRLWAAAAVTGATIDAGSGTDTLLAWTDVRDVLGFEVIDLRGSADLGVIADAIDNTVNGNSGANEIDGGDGADTIYGRGGADRLIGGLAADTLRGGWGADELIGGTDGDRLIGGWGADTFIYEAMTDSRRWAPDMIFDFQRGRDKIDLSELVDGPFRWIGKSSFTKSGVAEVNFRQQDDYTEIRIDLDGDGKFEMRIDLSQVTFLNAGDFIL